MTLREAGSPMTIPVLAYETALREVDSPSDVTDEHLDQVELALRHVHLPKLEEFEVIRYGADGRRISLADDIEAIESVIEATFSR
nr:hypothetical protein [Haloprofundus salilacus]